MRIIAGKYKNHPLNAPKGLATRPTSSKLREAVFNICQHHVDEANFLDVFAGSGAMGIEALSRGAAAAVFIDQSVESFRCIQENLERLKLQALGKVLRGDVWKMFEKLAKEGKRFEIIYIDPPYSLGAQPDFWSRLGGLLSILITDDGILFVEQGKGSEAPVFDQFETINSRQMGAAVLHQFQKEGS